MRVLMVNAFHYLRGGVERTYLDESRWLSEAGHEVAHFAVRDPRNLPSPTAAHFAPAADFGEHSSWWRQLGQADRVFWSAPAARAMERLLDAVPFDVAHVHAPSRYLTPSVLRPLERRGVPIVMTLHDFKPWCTNRVMFARGAECERCKGGHHWHAVAVGCVQGSRAKSLVGAIEAYAHDAVHAYRAVRLWIAPSRFVADKVREHGLDPTSVRWIPHGVELDRAGSVPGTAPEPVRVQDPVAPQPYVLFAGRLSEEKGVRLVPALAMRLAPTPVVVAGEGPLRPWLQRQADTVSNLRLHGHLQGDAFARLLSGAGVVVIPSLFYETFCYAAAEALAATRPVVASRIGAIPELIEHERTGLLVTPNDAHALAEASRRALDDPAAPSWGEAGLARVRDVADPRRHLDALLAVYREARDPSTARP
ncbi:MAG TPA: glycosyltransferase [Candidatus Limnocylindria bacterium]|nr:glycosyltransferase [Candidatus Limnocylindria bacterium]